MVIKIMGTKEAAKITIINKIITKTTSRTNNQVRMQVILERPLPMLQLNSMGTILSIISSKITVVTEVATEENKAAEETEEDTEEDIKEAIKEAKDTQMCMIKVLSGNIFRKTLSLKNQMFLNGSKI